MRGQIGNWGGKLSVSFGPEMLDWLDAYGTNRYVAISTATVKTFSDLEGKKLTAESRSILVSPSLKGTGGTYRVHAKGQSMYDRGVEAPYESVPGFEDWKMPRFELFELEFRASQDHLYADVSGMAPQLPWPKLRKSCELYSCREQMAVDLKIRMLSYLRAGSKGLFLRPPQRLIDALGHAEWRRIVEECKAEVDQ